jgi:tyrosyl-tRNA synthetase
MDFINELTWRGMVHSVTPGLSEKMNQGMVVGYAGFDPTAPSLQVGNLAAIMLLVHLQRCGHKPVVLIGGATGMIGDPSGKSEERVLMSADDVRFNAERFKVQLSRFLDFDKGENRAELVNNHDWFSAMSMLEFLRDAGKHLTVSYMMAKDSVQQRLEAGLSFTEFSYQLLQAWDFYHLYTTKNCIMQIGGSDQWGNITAGTELVRRKAGGEAFALTCPLVTRADGTKFGKSAAGEKLWLDPAMTSPYKFYQFWLNCSDVEAARFLRIFTLLTHEEITALEQEHALKPHERPLQKALAREVTVGVHSLDAYTNAVETSSVLFGKGTTEDLRRLSIADFLTVFEGVPLFAVPRSDLEHGIGIIDLLAVSTTILPSKSEARRMVKGNSISVNKSPVTGEAEVINADHLLQGRFILVQKGKKAYSLIEVR